MSENKKKLPDFIFEELPEAELTEKEKDFIDVEHEYVDSFEALLSTYERLKQYNIEEYEARYDEFLCKDEGAERTKLEDLEQSSFEEVINEMVGFTTIADEIYDKMNSLIEYLEFTDPKKFQTCKKKEKIIDFIEKATPEQINVLIAYLNAQNDVQNVDNK